MNGSIQRDARLRGVSRLCHFTPSRNLPHILDAGAILPTRHLKEDVRAVFNPTDLARLDGYDDQVCCSVQYPNGWYFGRARSEDSVFGDWVVLLIEPDYLWMDGTLFCYRNAAAERGVLCKPGYQAYQGMFADSVVGAYDRTYMRSAAHLPNCPTDNQAEVLVPHRILWKDVHGVAVSDEAQAQREYARLKLLGYPVDGLPVVVAPDLYNKGMLSKSIRIGHPVQETAWVRPREAL